MAEIKRERVVFGNFQESGHEALAGASPLAINVVIDAKGAVHRRPALVPRTSGSLSGDADIVSERGAIVGLHSTAGGRLFAVSEVSPLGHIYELRGIAVQDLSIATGSEVVGDRRPIFAETEAMLVISAGRAPQKVLLGPPTLSSRLAGGPPEGSHVIAHKSRLLLNDVRTARTNTIRYSWPAAGSSYEGHENWTDEVDEPQSSGFFNADARPDPVVALHENTNEVFAFGSTNLQVFTTTDSTEVTFAPSNTRELGCQAPYSIIKYDQSFAFIDSHRRVMMTDGRDYQCLSTDIQQTLDDIGDLSDAFGYRVTLGPVDALCWCSPTDGRTFVYQMPTKSWSQWHSYNNFTNDFAPWPVRCALRVPETGQMLVGAARSFIHSSGVVNHGDVYALGNDVFYDLVPPARELPDDHVSVRPEGTQIVARVDTGFVDRGTSGRKHCRALRLSWKGTPSTDTAAFVQWRDDAGPWEHPRQIEITGNSESILRSLGVYRRRQWRVTFSGRSELVLARAEEEFQLLIV